MCSNTILVATTEEKENRIAEMILTTIDARTLIIGKISAQWILMLIQVSLIALPVFLTLALAPNVLPFDLGEVPIDALQLVVGVVLALSGIALFTGLAFVVGAAMPSAKEANGFYSVIIMLLVLPIILITPIISQPDSPLVQFLTYFPLTAPMVVLLRSAFETLPAWLPLVAIVITLATACLTLLLAARLFRYGNLAYARRLSVKEILSKNYRA
jgi:ABC-2 type transport system permease protein